ncbi:hypothetical protein Tco_1299046 [Tanacetum coccineum]
MHVRYRTWSDVYLVFIDPESSTQADGAQSSRVPVPLPEDPYEVIRQAYLDGTNTESEPFEDPINTETLESPLTIAPPTSLSKSTPPVLVLIFCRTVRMVVRTPPAMSSGLSANLPLRNRYRGTSELVEDSEEDEEIEESMDSDNDEGYSVESDGLSLEEEEEAVPRGQQSALESERPERVSAFRQPTLTTWTNPEDGMVYIDVPTYPPPAPPVQTPPSPEWTSGSLPISPSHSDVPSPILLHIIPLTIPSHVATPTVVETEGFLTEL